MKLTRLLTLIIAGVGLLAFTLPAEAQSRGNRGGGNPNQGMRGGGNGNHGGWYGGPRGYYRGGSRVNVYFGGFGYPYYGFGYGYPYYYGYPYSYGYGSPYGYPVGGAYYSYDPRGIYQGRIANPQQSTNDGGGKDLSMAARVQRQLAEAGYYRGAIDGIVGDGTRRAIRNFERDNGLPVDGQIDNQLLATMGIG
ncbi:MAG: peptidoglycan-binding protein [Spartobacteria bacterium]